MSTSGLSSAKLYCRRFDKKRSIIFQPPYVGLANCLTILFPCCDLTSLIPVQGCFCCHVQHINNRIWWNQDSQGQKQKPCLNEKVQYKRRALGMVASFISTCKEVCSRWCCFFKEKCRKRRFLVPNRVRFYSHRRQGAVLVWLDRVKVSIATKRRRWNSCLT